MVFVVIVFVQKLWHFFCNCFCAVFVVVDGGWLVDWLVVVVAVVVVVVVVVLVEIVVFLVC